MSGIFSSYDMQPGADDEERKEAALDHVKEILLMHGATEEEIDGAVADGVIDLFVADRLLVPSRRRYTRVEVAELTGVSVGMLERFWRALGFPGVDDDDRAFTDLDLEAVQIFQGLQALGAADAETAVQMARVDRFLHGAHRRSGAGARGHGGRGGRPRPFRRGVRRRRRRHDSRHGQVARIRVAAPGGGRHSAQHDAAQPRSGARAEPGARSRVRRHGRVHAPEPASERRGARRRRAALRGDLPRHRDQCRGARGEDDRRRGHVRGRQRGRGGQDRAQPRRCLR